MRTIWILFLSGVCAWGQRDFQPRVVLTNSLAGPGWAAAAATFDGNDDWLDRGADLTGNSDSKVGLVSVWFKRTRTGTQEHFVGTDPGGDGFTVFINASDEVVVNAYSAGGTIILNMKSIATVTDTAWHHVMASWDMADTGKRHLYLDGADTINPITHTDAVIEYTQTNWRVGSRGDAFGDFWGCLTEFYFAVEYLDLSVSGNRDKFYSAGSPVNLGANGSTPTGSQPIIYLHAWDGANAGSGGNFTPSGALASCTAP
jgi:hypothetical protein